MVRRGGIVVIEIGLLFGPWSPSPLGGVLVGKLLTESIKRESAILQTAQTGSWGRIASVICQSGVSGVI